MSATLVKKRVVSKNNRSIYVVRFIREQYVAGKPHVCIDPQRLTKELIRALYYIGVDYKIKLVVSNGETHLRLIFKP